METASVKPVIIWDLDDTIYSRTIQVRDEFVSEDVQGITPFPGVVDIIKSQDYTSVLVTQNDSNNLQDKKLEVLKIRDLFESIYIVNKTKKDAFEAIISRFPRANFLVVGNRIDKEIRFGKELGLKTLFFKHGKYANLRPRDGFEVADNTIIDIRDVEKFVK